MSEKISPKDVTVLSATMLIPLWAKAVEYSRPDPLLRDAEAARMLGMIDYDFAPFAKAKASQPGCCGRARLLDDMAQRFIGEHPDAVVVQLGAGLDARYERMGRPQVTAWYDLDLPEVIEVRRRLLPESGNTYLGASLFDESWIDTAAAHGKPVLLIIEGVLMYFEEERVQAFLQTVQRKLPGTQIVMDTLFKRMVGKAQQHDALSQMGEKPPEFLWGIGNANDVLKLAPGSSLIEEIYLSSVCAPRYPFILRMIYKTKWGRENMDMRILRIQL
ncbi:O-Methyltransferase involved in polyketide biosynthesis [Kingella potus]|uniref:O-Methyltransferase involved in polyketide biosynthesis n=1 Tax=Kingella potus TaxID=265175 RepID=A0A377R1Y8_9NEIS|nr:class I SAM-dependent methyltransferase [Kingella potus]STR00321.1 O-Methyltransferase involved in polyketide biosynthesis [Kingella potus]